MHIAICDDNVADRKQLERLLGRESDERKNTTGVFYIDSFGNQEALLHAPMIYDAFFIDVVHGGENGFALAHRLRAEGVSAPIILMQSKLNYAQMEHQPFMVYHIEKPIYSEPLRNILNQTLQLKEFSSIHTIEIRCEKDTVYTNPNEIVLARQKNHLCQILLQDGTQLEMLGSLNDFFLLVQSTKNFLFAKKKLVVNMEQISSVKGFRLVLKNGMSFTLNPYDKIVIYQHLGS